MRHMSSAVIRAAAVVAVSAIVAAACSSGAATSPTAPSSSGSHSAVPSYWASPSDAAWPTYPAWPTDAGAPSPIARPSNALGGIDTVWGNAALMAPSDDEGAAAAGSINDFAFDLLRRFDSSGNLCASPTSIALALAMVRPGAHGVTGTEIDQVLHRFGAADRQAQLVALLASLQADSVSFDSLDPEATPTVLNISNAAFAQKGMTLQAAYLNALSSAFNAPLGLLDYKTDPEAARQAINAWVNARTNGRIPEVLQPGDVTGGTRIALANAIYLKAAWEHQFETDNTSAQPFTNAVGTKASVPTMAMQRALSYGAGTGYRAVELPYAGGTMAMTIIVPDNMASFVAGLNSSKLNAIQAGLDTYMVDLTLPRFSANTRIDLRAMLTAMGMPTAFTGMADLSGITTDEPLALMKVIHQANIDVVEKGTTAAAATVALGGATAGGPGEPLENVTFHVDKPFLYLIRDTKSGAVLFMGRIDDPSH